MKNIKKYLSIMLMVVFIATMLPMNIFAATVMEENYGEMTDFSDNFGWKISTQPTHAAFQKTTGGVRILQTKQTAYKEGTTEKNTTLDGTYIKNINSILKSDSTSGMQIIAPGATGNVKITIDYVIDQKSETDSANSYYPLNIAGYINLRLYNGNVTVLNTSSVNNSTMSTQALKSAGGAGTDKQVVIEIDTVNDYVTVTHNGNVSKGDSVNKVAGKAGAGGVKSISVSNMQRMNEGAYLKFTSIKVESDTEATFVFDEVTQTIINGFPASLAPDSNNVTENITLPTHIEGIKWSTSDKNVMTKTGRISRTSQTDPTKVVISGTFDVKTTDGKVFALEVQYPLNVTGVTSRSENTTIINPTPGATDTTEKWYTMPQRGNEEDGYPMFDDPDYITDEAFFGKWDSSKSIWTLEPYFRYSDYSHMAKVEAAAKAGDYETAKDELVVYYRTLASERVSSVNSISNANKEYYDALYQLMSRNAYVTNFISNYVINMFSIPKEWSDVKIDVTNRLNEAKGSYGIFTLVVASVDKYRNQAEVYSRESAYAPVIEATVNGEKRIFTVEKDATLQGGQYSNTNFGKDTVLYAEEAGSWADPEDRTKRMFIGFDVSGLKRSDTITDAKIILRARHTGTDDEKLMAAYWIGESSWLENKVCWNTFVDHMYFSCNDMYCWDWVTSNSTTIKGKVCGYHRDTEPATLATSYSYYVQHPELEQYPEKYAYTYLRQYMGLINSIGVEPDVMNQLDMSTHISGVSQDILRLMNSKYMTGEVFTAYLKHLWLLTDYHVYNWYGKAKNNFATFSTGAVYNMCARFPEFERHDIWTKETKKENDRVFDGFTFEDGMCLELSHNYHSTLLGTFATPFSTYELTGEPLPYSEKTTEIIHDIVLSLFNQSGPYFGGFNMGDGYDPYRSYKSTFTKWYNYLFSDDPTIAYMAGKGGWLPELCTSNYPSGQRTVMRSDWSQNALALAMTNKMVGSHGHKDALSIAMFAYGKYLLTDQGYGSVQTGNTMYYMKSPQQHNVVTVNDSKNYIVDGYVINDVRAESYDTVQSVDGTQMIFDCNDNYDFVEYNTPAYTSTEKSQRSVMFLKNQKFWIVTDYHIPNDTTVTNEFAQNWHLYPGAEMTIDPTTKVIESHFADEPNVMIVPVDPATIDKTEVRGTWYSENGGQINDSEKGMLYRNKTGNGVFSTIILPMDIGENFDVTTTKLTNALSDENINLFSFTVKNEVTGEQSKFYYYHVNEESLQTTVNVGEYSTDANTLLVEEDTEGNVISLYMVDGTFVNKGSVNIIKTVDGSAANLSFNITDGVLDFHSSERDIKVLENTLINSSLATSVKYNKTENVPFAVVEGNMTFADVKEDIDVTASPDIGTLVYDSDVNPELLNVYLNNSNEFYKATNTIGQEGGGIRFESVKSDSTQSGGGNAVGSIRFSGIFEDEENNTKTVTDLMSGKYAIEMTIQQNIVTDRVNEDGKNWPTYATMHFGLAAENADGTLKSGFSNQLIEFRLYTEKVNIIRYENTQADGIRNDVDKVSMQNFEADKEWTLRLVVDTETKTYTVFVNDVLERGAMNFPYNINTKGNLVPDFAISLMKANNVGSYVQINNVKIYEIESKEDERYNVINLLPAKLLEGNPNAVFGNLSVPALSGVTWTSSNTDLIGINGVLKSKVAEATPITFTASGTVSDTEVKRTYKFSKMYNMNVVPSLWKLTASKSDNVVTASVTNVSDDASMVAYMVIAEYDAKGKLIGKKVEEVKGKLENYTYTVSNGTVKTKVFLFDGISTVIPLYKHYIFN